MISSEVNHFSIPWPQQWNLSHTLSVNISVQLLRRGCSDTSSPKSTWPVLMVRKPTQRRNVHLTNLKPLCFASLVFARLVICAGLTLARTNRLVSMGGIDRVGLSPLQRAGQMHPKVLASANTAAYSEGSMEPTTAATMLRWHTAPTGRKPQFL
jgi:hypothetical protein